MQETPVGGKPMEKATMKGFEDLVRCSAASIKTRLDRPAPPI